MMALCFASRPITTYDLKVIGSRRVKIARAEKIDLLKPPIPSIIIFQIDSMYACFFFRTSDYYVFVPREESLFIIVRLRADQ